MQEHVDWRGLIVSSLPFPIYRKARICGTNGVAARPKCGCELSPRPYLFSADRLCEGEATEKENTKSWLGESSIESDNVTEKTSEQRL